MKIETNHILNAIHNAGLFVAAAKENRPTLRTVLVTYTAPSERDNLGRLRMVATDSYGLIRINVPLSDADGTDWECLVPWDDLVRATKMFNAKTTPFLEVLEPDDSKSLAFGLSDGTATLQPEIEHGTYPNWEPLFPSGGAADSAIAIAPFQLARLAKLKGQNDRPVRFKLFGELKPCTFAIGNDIDGIVMPVRCMS